MLADVRVGQVMGLIDIMGGRGSAIGMPTLVDRFGADLVMLRSVISEAELLGLVKSEDGTVSPTELGMRLWEVTEDRHRIAMLREVLAGIEPFRTALELVFERESVTVDAVANALRSRGLVWKPGRDSNKSTIRALLIHWGIHAELLSYNGKTDRLRGLQAYGDFVKPRIGIIGKGNAGSAVKRGLEKDIRSE
jgi:hypothetical protein